MQTLQNRTIGQIVADDYRTAEVFRHFGLDFCCGGGKTIEEACAEKDLDPQKVKGKLQQLGEKRVAGNQHYDLWSLDFLIDYIVNNHHQFVRNKLPEIETYGDKVSNVHGGSHEELYDIYEEVVKLKEDMLNHLQKEEEILFPYIKQLVFADEKDSMPENVEIESAAEPIEMMEGEHEEAGESMEKIRRLSNDFTPPSDACTTYRLLFKNLEGFERDLHKHVHLENNILFPKALKIERRRN